jgi:hypothetical protein
MVHLLLGVARVAAVEFGLLGPTLAPDAVVADEQSLRIVPARCDVQLAMGDILNFVRHDNYIPAVILHTKQTGWHENGLNS